MRIDSTQNGICKNKTNKLSNAVDTYKLTWTVLFSLPSSRPDFLGRKRAMMVVNIPLIIAWFLLTNATEVWQIFMANILFGLASGLTESPTITYIGEICEPAFRGILIAYTHAGWTLGMLVVSILNTLLPWRTVALVCMFVPVLTTLALCFVSNERKFHQNKSLSP